MRRQPPWLTPVWRGGNGSCQQPVASHDACRPGSQRRNLAKVRTEVPSGLLEQFRNLVSPRLKLGQQGQANRPASQMLDLLGRREPHVAVAEGGISVSCDGIVRQASHPNPGPLAASRPGVRGCRNGVPRGQLAQRRPDQLPGDQSGQPIGRRNQGTTAAPCGGGAGGPQPGAVRRHLARRSPESKIRNLPRHSPCSPCPNRSARFNHFCGRRYLAIPGSPVYECVLSETAVSGKCLVVMINQ